MKDIQSIKIVSTSPTSKDTRVYLDGKDISRSVLGVSFEFKPGGANVVHLDLLPETLEVEGPAEIVKKFFKRTLAGLKKL